MDQGNKDLSHLRQDLVASGHPAWIRAVAACSEDGQARLLFALVVVGPEPDGWSEKTWSYEQCRFSSGSMSAGEFSDLLVPGQPRTLELGGDAMLVELADAQFSWFRRPSLAEYDKCRFTWPADISTPGMASQGAVHVPTGMLIGPGMTPSFSLFSAAFGAFFYDDYSVSGTQNPLLGQMSIRILDTRARIEGVDQDDAGLAIAVGGSDLVDAYLEFNSKSHREIVRLDGAPGPVHIALPSEEIPEGAWVWLKGTIGWLDYRSLHRWGGQLSPDVRLRGPRDEAVKANQRSEPPAQVASALHERATSYVKRALGSYVGQSDHDFFLFAGCAVELAAKSQLAGECAAFLAPGQHFPSAVELWKARDDVRQLATGTRTVGGLEAFRRLATMRPELRAHEGGVAELFAYRNGEAHLGAVDTTLRTSAFVTFLEGVRAVLGDDAELWRPHDELVRVTLDENAERISRDVQLRLSRARERFGLLKTSLGEGHVGAIAMLEMNAIGELDLNEAIAPCPACGSKAVARGVNELEYGEPDFGKDGEIEGVPSWLEFRALSLKCEICGLELLSLDEVKAAGMSERWINEGADLLDAFRELEAERNAELFQYVDYDEIDTDPEES
jgi:hypothetical protein